MTDDRIQRRLAAILICDVVGYSRLMSQDEAGTRSRFNTHLKELFEPSIASHHGRIVKTIGDGLLVEFASVVDAVQCAIETQKGMAERNRGEPDDRRIDFRIGVNLGDVIVEGDDIHGDGVNVAARLEGLAQKGGICISRSARDQVRDKLDCLLLDLGKIEVKNIARPVRAFSVVLDGNLPATTRRQIGMKGRLVSAAIVIGCLLIGGGLWWSSQVERTDPAGSGNVALILPDKPSIAVLPFENASADKEQEYFSDGLTEDIITDLSKISGLFVIARNSTFTYKGLSTKVREVGKDLGVRYVLQGSVRRTQGKLRITAQLVDASTGGHLWAERYDREPKDVFSVQADVARQVAKALAVTLKANEIERLFQKYTASIDAYDIFLQARRTVDAPTKDNLKRGQKLFAQVIELDPNFAGGYAGLALNLSVQVRFQFSNSPKADLVRSFELAKTAVQVDRNFAWAHIALGGAYLANGDADAALRAARQALALEPGGYEANLFMGFFLQFAGDSSLAVRHLLLAKRLSPVESYRDMAFMALAQFMDRNYTEVVRIYSEIERKFPRGLTPNGTVVLAAAYTLMDKPVEAVGVVKKLRQTYPKFNLSQWRFFESWKSEENRTRLYNAAKRAGVREHPNAQ